MTDIATIMEHTARAASAFRGASALDKLAKDLAGPQLEALRQVDNFANHATAHRQRMLAVAEHARDVANVAKHATPNGQRMLAIVEHARGPEKRLNGAADGSARTLPRPRAKQHRYEAVASQAAFREAKRNNGWP